MQTVNLFTGRAAAFIILIISGIRANSQNTTPYGTGIPVNTIRTWEAVAPVTDPNVLITKPVQDVKQAAAYYDGLGRPLQTVVFKGSMATGVAATDMVSPVMYDELGREQFKYLPFASTENNGLFKMNPFQQQLSFMQGQYADQGESVFYGKTVFEASPLNRTIKTLAPGNNWAGAANGGRGVEIRYFQNTLTDDIKIWQVGTAGIGSFAGYTVDLYNSSGVYPAGMLMKTITLDEHGNQVIEFKDKEGHVLVKKVQLTAAADDGNGSGYDGWMTTIYMYDYLGQLRCVVQPEGVKQLRLNGWSFNTVIQDEQSFRYEYDQRGRMIMKKVPGAAAVYMVYDKRDRLVMTQDGNLRNSGNWLVTKYDSYNRPYETGLLYNIDLFTNHLSNAFNADTYPSISGTYTLLTSTHYDNYTGLPAPLSDYLATWNSNFSTQYSVWPYPQNPDRVQNIKGKIGWTQTRVLGTSNFIYSVTYYDAKDRVIQVQSTNLAGGVDVVSSQFTWAGQPFIMVMRQQKPGSGTAAEHIQVTKFAYDELGRVLNIRKSVSTTLNGVTKTIPETEIVKNEYDKLGQLKEKKIGKKKDQYGVYGIASLESLTYDYNIRGWMLGVNRAYARDANNNNYFGFDLGYDKQANNLVGAQTYNAPQYNGNISGMVWKSKGDGEKRKYDFRYDAANRILKADFSQYTGGWFNQSAGMNFNMVMGGTGLDPLTAYDDNGNIKRMQQWGIKVTGSLKIDDLNYSYLNNEKSNRLRQVTDAVAGDNKLGDFKDGANFGTDDYVYDVNGNMTIDQNKGISNIVYNHLNLPQAISVTGKGTINYIYDAGGTKLQKITSENNATVTFNGTTYTAVTITTTTNYIGGSVYETKSYSNPALQGSTLAYTDKYQFSGFEEGRIRPTFNNLQAFTGLSLDYMLKDHLGNVRMVITDEVLSTAYPAATMEPATINEESKIYTNLTNTQVDKPGWFTDNLYLSSTKVARLKNDAGSQKVGPNMLLKVMAGDSYNIRVSSGWNSGADPNNIPANVLTDLFNQLTTGLSAINGGKASLAELQNPASGINSGLNTFMNQQGTEGSKPKAYISWVLLDEQFKVAQDANGNIIGEGYSGFEQVGGSGTATPHTRTNLTVAKSGYLYIYTSNESANIDVFFDNLQVTHNRGAILEETHYYPFGLIMSGLSSKSLAFGKPENSEKTFQGQRADYDIDLNWIQFKWRNHDPQIGRFIEIDPLSTKYEYNSTFAFSENKVIVHVELEGLESTYSNSSNSYVNAIFSPSVQNQITKYNRNAGGALTGTVKVGPGIGVSLKTPGGSIEAGVSGPQISLSSNLAGDNSINYTTGSAGVKIKVGCLQVKSGVSVGNIDYENGVTTATLLRAGVNWNATVKKEVKLNENNSQELSASIPSSEIGMGLNAGAVGADVTVDAKKGGNAVVGFFETITEFIKSYAKEKTKGFGGSNKDNFTGGN